MRIRFSEKDEHVPDIWISKNKVLTLIANYQMGTNPHTAIGEAQYQILEMLFRSICELGEEDDINK